MVKMGWESYLKVRKFEYNDLYFDVGICNIL